ncbi:hypothetical protein EK904_000187 [Melospiza melodia maxima]|nr:hypothetical protein EK904_000187 [Melospiza melodia maxima]
MMEATLLSTTRMFQRLTCSSSK